MAAIDLSSVTRLPYSRKVTLSATTLLSQRFTLSPLASYRVSFFFDTNDGLVSTDLSVADGVAIDGHAFPVPADAPYTEDFLAGSHPGGFNIASATGSTVAYVSINRLPVRE